MAVVERRRIGSTEFDRLVSPLLLLRVTRPWRGHGSAMFLELGPLKRVARRRRPGHYLQGRATVMLEGTWRVERHRSIDFGALSAERRIAHRLEKLKGLFVESVQLEGRLPELQIGLSTGRYVRSFMTWESQPQWTLFLPDASWLCVRRGTIVREFAS